MRGDTLVQYFDGFGGLQLLSTELGCPPLSRSIDFRLNTELAQRRVEIVPPSARPAVRQVFDDPKSQYRAKKMISRSSKELLPKSVSTKNIDKIKSTYLRVFVEIRAAELPKKQILSETMKMLDRKSFEK